MSNPEISITESDDSAKRVREVINDCLRRRAAGDKIDDEELLAAYPDLLPGLQVELNRLRLIVTARERAAQPIGSEVETRSHRDSDTGSGRLEIRCPSCHAQMDVAVDSHLTDLTCSACGSHFSLVDQSKATRLAPMLTKLGRFELIERLGVGGFGSVWKARDKELDRTVAIKIPREGGMTSQEQEDFFREARASAQLRHPSIVGVHEVGRDGDSIYIVSDFVRGVTLGDWLTGQKLNGRESAEAMRENRRSSPSCARAGRRTPRLEAGQYYDRWQWPATYHGFWPRPSRSGRGHCHDRRTNQGDTGLYVARTG